MIPLRYSLSLLIILLFFSCSQEPPFDTSTDEFILQDGFTIQTIAAEPLLDSPVALSFDNRDRIWAVELPGYMRDIDGSDEEKADGRIVLLEDKNGDGVMDSRRVILDKLQAPRTLLHVYGGLLYSNGGSLFWAKLNNTILGEPLLVDSLYVVGGNIEHQPNSLHYHLDNWIYSANSRTRYRLKDGAWLKEATSFRGQWGLSADIDGRFYYNNNHLPVATDYAMPNQLIQNPWQKVQYGHTQDVASSREIYGYQATAVNRGYQEGVLDAEGKIRHFTSACSPLVYTGNRLGSDLFQDVFVCAPEANLIKRYVQQVKDGQITAFPAYDSTEFLISKDETFRPVNLYNAPDGSMYILDLRKGIIQHRAYMTSYLREKILERGLETFNGRGRIYRVTSTDNESFRHKKPVLRSDADWVIMLASDLHYERLAAQKELVHRQATALKSSIEAIALNTDNPYGQLHALWTLEGMNELDAALWQKAANVSNAPIVHETLIRFSAFFTDDKANQLAYFRRLAALDNRQIDQQLVMRLGGMNTSGADELLLELASGHGNDAVLAEALISGIHNRETEFLRRIRPLNGTDSLQNFLKIALANAESNTVQAPQLPKAFYKDDRTAGFELYQLHCAGCHGMDGKGIDNMAPPLLGSEFVGGSLDRLILLTLNGLKGPLTVNGKRYKMNAEMPGIKNNPALSDEDITALLTFTRNSFSFANPWFPVEKVTKWREATKDRTELFTAEELERY